MSTKKNALSEVLSRLDTTVSVLREREAEKVLAGLTADDKNDIIRKDGKIYALREETLYCTDDIPGAADLMRMLLLIPDVEDGGSPRTCQEALRHSLNNRISSDEAQEMNRRFGFRSDGSFRVIVFRIEECCRKENAYNELTEIFPLEDKDYPVRMNCSEFIIIHGCGKDETADDTAEYCLALCETAESEADIRLKAGVSAQINSPCEFYDACRQGREAISVAARFHRIGPVWIYEKLLLERFLNDIPASVYGELRSRVMTAEVSRLLTGEMLETVNMFFKCDLNLSDTARQMFIHRNTLMYRLDKIQKITGLDLRRFYDAVVFRIIMELPDT